MKLAFNVMYMSSAMFFVVCMHGCANVTQPQPLHDGRWGAYNNAVAEQCAIAALIAGIDSKQIEAMFNKCVFDQGLTI
jgi:hypothetical protein